MPTPIPLNQSSRNILLALINRDNNTTETFTTLSFGTTAAQTEGALRDTMVRVSAVEGSGRMGFVDMFYNRLTISELFLIDPLPIPYATYNTTYDIAEYINTQYGIALDAEDVVLDSVSGTTAVLTILPTSYAWQGSLNIEISPEGIDLPSGTYLNVGDGSLFAVGDNTLLLLGP